MLEHRPDEENEGNDLEIALQMFEEKEREYNARRQAEMDAVTASPVPVEVDESEVAGKKVSPAPDVNPRSNGKHGGRVKSLHIRVNKQTAEMASRLAEITGISYNKMFAPLIQNRIKLMYEELAPEIKESEKIKKKLQMKMKNIG